MKKSPNRFVRVVFWSTMAFLYVPLAYLIIQAFLKNPNELAQGFTTKWIIALFQSSALWEPLRNSVVIAVCSATISVGLGTLGAIGLGRRKAEVPLALQSLILLPVLLPEVITGLSLLLFFLIVKVPLGMATVVLAHASFSASFVYFVIVEQVKKLDPQIGEAARDLGATGPETFWKVIFPNILPGVLGGWLLAFTLSFDDFLISFFTAGAGLTTLPLKIYSLLRVGLSPELNALALVMIVSSISLVGILASRESSRKWILRG